MKLCVLMYTEGNGKRQTNTSLGEYHFQELPRIGETIHILSDHYEVVGVEHEFLKASTSDNISSENKTIVYIT